MPQAGYCSECKANIWLTPEGTCPAGHGAECVSNVYEAPAPPAPPSDASVGPPVGQPDGTQTEKRGWFTRLPLWGKILFVIIWPVSVIYGLYWMWKDKKFSMAARIVLTIGAALLFLIGFASGNSNTPTSPTASAPTRSATAVSQPATSQAGSSTSAAPTEPSASATEPAAPTPAPAKTVYKKLSTRGFQKLAKDPDSYAGDTYIIWGEITQFDSATGVDTFRADTGAKKKKPSYGFVNYAQNAILTGDESSLSDYVEGDLFRAKVTVVGSYTYDTQIGGSTTVPEFQVDSISRYGHVSN
jgi:hypothetical protein